MKESGERYYKDTVYKQHGYVIEGDRAYRPEPPKPDWLR